MKENLVFLPLKEVTRGGSLESKADRIGKLEPLYRAHSIWHMSHLKGGKLEEQLLRFNPGGAVHDDYPDALSTAVAGIAEGHLRKQSGSMFGPPRRRYESTGF